MDYIEYKILHALQNNARLSNIELAKEVGLTPSPCLRRVKNLEQKGVISGYSALINQNKVGLSVNVFVQVSLERQTEDHLEVFEEQIKEYSEVMEAYLMTGEADYLLRIVVKDLEKYESFLKENPSIAKELENKILENAGIVEKAMMEGEIENSSIEEQ